MSKTYDCVFCGSLVMDVLVRPVPLTTAIGAGGMILTDPIQLATGGLASNAATAMSRLGMKAAVVGYVGADEWGEILRRGLEHEGVNCQGLGRHASIGTSTSAVLIDAGGERTFAHYEGACNLLDRELMLKNFELFARSRMMLLGYYSQLPRLEPDLPEVLAAIRATGCQTALDSAGSGGSMQPLEHILPQVDVYVPSRLEAMNQTGKTDPREMIETFRRCGAPGIVGIKLGDEGALLSPSANVYIHVPCITPEEPIIDTTGAGDAFYCGLLVGLLRGMDVKEAGRMGAATAASCITALGATEGIQQERLMKLAD